MSRFWASARRVGSCLFLPLLMASAEPARAGMLAFDFDTDGDPTTIENLIQAEAGELVTAQLVLTSIPYQYPWLQAAQFGLQLSSGLEYLGMSSPTPSAMFLQDGIEGIAVSYRTPVHITELPIFVMRFVIRVLDVAPQTVAVVPSTGWNRVLDSFHLVLSTDSDGAGQYLLKSYSALLEQRQGRVNGEATPAEETSWSRLKSLYSEVEGGAR